MKKIFIIFASAFLLFSCNNEEQLGADFEEVGNIPAPVGDFKISRDPVDFTQGDNVYFEQEFEKPTHWKLILTGTNTGATKTFEYVSTSLNKENTLWDGRPDEPPYFQIEDVVARLTFPSYPFNAIVDTFTIEGIRNTEILTTLFTDFTTAPLYKFGQNPPSGGGWANDFPPVNNASTQYDKYDGTAYLYMEGEARTNDNPFINIVQIPTIVSGGVTDSVIPLSPDPNRVYLNVAIYGTDTDEWLNIELVNEKRGITGTWTIKPTWTGWKFISIKLSNLTVSDGSTFDPSGISLTNLVLLHDGVLTVTPRVTSKIAIDQMVYSLDSPLGTVNY